jgi:uncharacterized protein YeaO (DUF488 family)
MAIAVKRVYEKAVRADGTRVLVDRLWPRGLSKETAAVHLWLRDLAPSDELRKWYHATSNGWITFRKRYLKELARPEAARALEDLHDLVAKRKKVTLLFASRNETQNNATVLKQLLEGMRKPPTGTGPGAVKAWRTRRAARRSR